MAIRHKAAGRLAAASTLGGASASPGRLRWVASGRSSDPTSGYRVITCHGRAISLRRQREAAVAAEKTKVGVCTSPRWRFSAGIFDCMPVAWELKQRNALLAASVCYILFICSFPVERHYYDAHAHTACAASSRGARLKMRVILVVRCLSLPKSRLHLSHSTGDEETLHSKVRPTF